MSGIANFVSISLICVFCSALNVMSKSPYCDDTEQYYTNYVESDMVPNPDATLAVLQKTLAAATDNIEKEELKTQISKILQSRCKTDEIIEDLMHEIAGGDEEKIKSVKAIQPVVDQTTIGCNKQITKTFIRSCLKAKPEPYQLQSIKDLTKFCHVKYVTWKQIVDIIKNKCA